MTVFSPTVLEHFRRPRNHRRLEAPDVAREAYNPVCGDRIRLELRVGDGVVVDAAFRGDGCALSIAAASLLTELLRGRTLEAAAAFDDAELLAALDATVPATRLACALLPLRALRDGLAARGAGA